uniref:Uncharacterized protein n=1 Tax=Anguilla anguilla TaxID=7936 RepID=A0A0E9UZ62_ANGAN
MEIWLVVSSNKYILTGDGCHPA